MATAPVTTVEVTVPTYQVALLKLASKLTTQVGKTEADTAAMEVLIADRFTKNSAMYRKEGGIIAEMLALVSDGAAKPWTEEALHTLLTDPTGPYKVEMSLTRFNRAHRIHKAFVGQTDEEVAETMAAYRRKRIDNGDSLDVKSLVSFVAGTGSRGVPTAEQMVNRHKRALTGSLVDFTAFDDVALEALVKQVKAEQAFRKWCDENPTDSAASAHRAAVIAGVAAAKAQRAAAVGTGV